MVLSKTVALFFFFRYAKAPSVSSVTTNVVIEENNEISNVSLLLAIFKTTYDVDYWKSCCFFSDQDIDNINIHWLKFSPPEKGHFYVLAIVYLLVMIIGIVGNSTVIILFFR